MNKQTFKNVFIAVSVAVLAGLSLVIASPDFGKAEVIPPVKAPTYNPPGGNVSPTFTGLNVQGSIVNSSDTVNNGLVYVNDSLSATSLVSRSTLAVLGDVLLGSGTIPSNLDIVGKMAFIGSGNEDGIVSGIRSIFGRANTALVIYGGSTAGNNASTPIILSSGLGGIQMEGNVTANAGVDVTGKLTANSIGSYSNKSSSRVPIAANGYVAVVTPACNAGGIMLNCQSKAYTASTGTVLSDAFSLAALFVENNSCTIKAKNVSAGTAYIQAIGTCFYPAE